MMPLSIRAAAILVLATGLATTSAWAKPGGGHGGGGARIGTRRLEVGGFAAGAARCHVGARASCRPPRAHVGTRVPSSGAANSHCSAPPMMATPRITSVPRHRGEAECCAAELRPFAGADAAKPHRPGTGHAQLNARNIAGRRQYRRPGRPQAGRAKSVPAGRRRQPAGRDARAAQPVLGQQVRRRRPRRPRAGLRTRRSRAISSTRDGGGSTITSFPPDHRDRLARPAVLALRL